MWLSDVRKSSLIPRDCKACQNKQNLTIYLYMCNVKVWFLLIQPSHYLFNERHVTLILCKGSIIIFNLHSDNRTSFLKLKTQTFHLKHDFQFK